MRNWLAKTLVFFVIAVIQFRSDFVQGRKVSIEKIILIKTLAI